MLCSLHEEIACLFDAQQLSCLALSFGSARLGSRIPRLRLGFSVVASTLVSVAISAKPAKALALPFASRAACETAQMELEKAQMEREKAQVDLEKAQLELEKARLELQKARDELEVVCDML